MFVHVFQNFPLVFQKSKDAAAATQSAKAAGATATTPSTGAAPSTPSGEIGGITIDALSNVSVIPAGKQTPPVRTPQSSPKTSQV